MVFYELIFLCRVTLAQSMLAGALYFTSSTIESSVLNMIPAITYILSLISRQEKLEIHTSWGKGKIFGTLMSVSGALTLMLWHGSGAEVMSTSMGNWLVGLVMVVVGVVAFSTWILMLVSSSHKYLLVSFLFLNCWLTLIEQYMRPSVNAAPQTVFSFFFFGPIYSIGLAFFY